MTGALTPEIRLIFYVYYELRREINLLKRLARILNKSDTNSLKFTHADTPFNLRSINGKHEDLILG